MTASKRRKARRLGLMKDRNRIAPDFDAAFDLLPAERGAVTQYRGIVHAPCQPVTVEDMNEATQERAVGTTGTIRLTKLDAAVHQLNAGIRLYLSGDAISALTLAGAAEETLGALCKAKGQKSAMQFLYGWAQENLDSDVAWKDFVAGMNEVRNALKHAHHEHENDFEFHPMLTVQMIMRAVPMCNFLGVPESQEMKDFRAHKDWEWPTAGAAAKAHDT